MSTFVENVNIVAAGMGVLNVNQDDLNELLAKVGVISGVTNGYITYGLPLTGNLGDIAINTLDGGIYQWKVDTGDTDPSWVLIAQSSGSTGGTTVAEPPVHIVTGLPPSAENGEIVFNTADGYFYGYINGVWTQMISTPTTTDQVGIEVVTTDPTTDNYEGRVVFNTTDNQLKKYTGGAWIQVVEPTTAAATVADGSLTTAAFASTIRPVEIFDTLPTTGNAVGRLVYLTSDGLLYRYTATGFSTAVPAGTITGTITSTQIADDAITTPKIAVGAITADEIASNAITSDKITANSITTGMIQAGAIGATQIATNAITAEKLNAGSVTASKIAALSIDATKIVAGSIGADQIAANAITAGKIAAGAVSANNIAAGTITATQIASGTITAAQLAAYSVTADKIQTGSITLDKLTSSSTVANGVTFGLGNGANISGYTAGGFFSATTSDKFGLLASNSNGMAFATGNVGNNPSAGFFNSTNTTYSIHKTYSQCATDTFAGNFVNNLSGKQIILSNMTYAFQTNGGTVGSFTGSHDGLILKTSELPMLGDIMVDESVYAVKDMDDSMCVNTMSTVVNQKNVVGVFNGKTHSSHVPTSVSTRTRMEDGTYKSVVDTSKYTDFNNYYMITISAIGEGLINVCGLNGSIEAGDLICSSSIKGKGMKQDDDLVRNYTVAKARESVTFDSPEQVKQIACIYMCG